MPKRTCPKCQAFKEYDMEKQLCIKCGFDVRKSQKDPPHFVKEKNDKHTYGTEEKDNKNYVWLPGREKKIYEIVGSTLAYGSQTASNSVIITFEEDVGVCQENKEITTKWVKVMNVDDPNKMHAFPLNPYEYANIDFECQTCHHIHNGKSPLLCEECGKPPYLKKTIKK